MSKIPDAIRVRTEDLEKAEVTRTKLQDLQASWDSSQRLATKEIPELKNRLADLSSQKSTLSESVDDVSRFSRGS
jgi:hypothetical protein